MIGLFIVPLLLGNFCLQSIDYFNDCDGSNDRYEIVNDPDDTTGWNNAYSLTENVIYNSAFLNSDDEDFYSFTNGSYYRPLAIQVFSNDQIATIGIYDTTYALLFWYNSDVQFTYSAFRDYLIHLVPNETIYISVHANTTASYYSIKANTNPNLSGINVISASNASSNIKFNLYYGQSNLTNIKYKIDSSCNYFINNSFVYTYNLAFNYAINFWNTVGGLELKIVSSGQNVVLKVGSYLDMHDLDSSVTHDTLGVTIIHAFRDYPITSFSASVIMVNNNYSLFDYFGSTTSQIYKAICDVCIHEIGHSLGLAHSSSNKKKNLMYPFADNVEIINLLGDGDYSSYNYLWGSL